MLETAYRQLIIANALGTGALNNDAAFPGYRSSQPPQPESIGNYSDPNWFLANGVCAAGCAADANGNVSYYVVHRMCTQPNTAYNGVGPTGAANACATFLAVGGVLTGQSMAVGNPGFIAPPEIYYRVTTLVVGPRNSSSVVQAMLVFSN